MVRTWEALREEYLRSTARFEAHIEECTRLRAEDIRVQAERHLENQRRLTVQDQMQEKLAHTLDEMRGDMSKQLVRMIWTVASGLAAVGLSMLGFILQHVIK